MYFDIDGVIVESLKKAFEGESISENIYPIISRDDIKTKPLRFPAIRVVFLGLKGAESLDVEYEEDIVELRYGVIYYIRSFKDKTAQSIYSDILKIVSALKNLKTDRGVLSLEGCDLFSSDGYYAYMCEFSIQTII